MYITYYTSNKFINTVTLEADLILGTLDETEITEEDRKALQNNEVETMCNAIRKKILQSERSTSMRKTKENMSMQRSTLVTLFITHTPVDKRFHLMQLVPDCRMVKTLVNRIIDCKLPLTGTSVFQTHILHLQKTQKHRSAGG